MGNGRAGLTWRITGVVTAIVLVVLVRVIALDSDAYPRLSWSSGLLTDEGFYLHDARNTLLFGQPSTDAWNNRLLMPALHFTQVAWFHLLGVGAVQARLLSVLLSLLSLSVFFLALRTAFGLRVAALGTLLLGLEHPFLLYNRLALMDTPALLPLLLALLCLLGAFPRPQAQGERAGLGAGWLLLSGLLLALSYATRGLCALVFPAFLLALLWQGQAGRRGACWLLLGLGLGLGLYGLLVYLPHRQELLRLNRYYLSQQLIPSSFWHLWQNVEHALLGDERGLSPYLLRHTPVLTLLALLTLGGWTELRKQQSPRGQVCGDLLVCWLLSMWLLLAVVSYSPSRYYVLFYPALAGLAGMGLVEWQALWQVWQSHAWWRGLLGAWLGYHVLEALVHQGRLGQDLLLYAAAGVGAWLLVWGPGLGARGRGRSQGLKPLAGKSKCPQDTPRLAMRTASPVADRLAVGPSDGSLPARHGIEVWVPLLGLGLWALVNGLWLGNWLGHLTFKQKQADAWLQDHLPKGSVLIGAVAPGLCLNNHFKVVNVIEDLCNDDHPVERFAPAPRYIVILDGKWKERWWVRHYPELVKPERRMHLFLHLLRHDFYVGVYPVPPQALSSAQVKGRPTHNLETRERLYASAGTDARSHCQSQARR